MHPHVTGLVVVVLVITATLVAAITAISLFYCIYKCNKNKQQKYKISRESEIIPGGICPKLKVLEPTPLKLSDKKGLSNKHNWRTNKLLLEPHSSKIPKYQIEIARQEETSSIYSCIPDPKRTLLNLNTPQYKRNSLNSNESTVLRPIALFSMNPKAEGCDPLSISLYSPSTQAVPTEMIDSTLQRSGQDLQAGGIEKGDISTSLQTVFPMNEKDEMLKEMASSCSFPDNLPTRQQRLDEDSLDIIHIKQVKKSSNDSVIDMINKEFDFVFDSDLKSPQRKTSLSSPCKSDTKDMIHSLGCLGTSEKVNLTNNELVVTLLDDDVHPLVDVVASNEEVNSSILDLMSLASPYLNIISLPASPLSQSLKATTSSQTGLD